MKRFAFLFGTICVGFVAAHASATDALWDRTAEKVRRGQGLLPAESKISSEVLRGNGGLLRTFSVTVKQSVQDGQVVREIVGERPNGRQDQPPRFAEGQGPGANSPLRGLFEGLSPFAEAVKVEAANSGETRTIGGENAVRYEVQWTDEAGYAFSGSVWISPTKEAPLRAEYVMQKRPSGAEIKELRASVSFGSFQGLPVSVLKIVEAKITPSLFISVNLRSTTEYTDYFDPSKEND